MPYYSGYAAGDYYQGGDYYQAGGFLGSFGKLLGGVAKTAFGLTPVGKAVSIVAPRLFGGGPRPNVTPIAPGLTFGGGTIAPVPGITGAAQRFFPGGATGYELRRPRRMNPLNIKALRRAMRRAKGFERQARRVGSFFNPGKTFRLKGRARRRS